MVHPKKLGNDFMHPGGRKTSLVYGLNHVPRPILLQSEAHNQRCVTAWIDHKRQMQTPPPRLPPVACILRPGTLKSLPPDPPPIFLTKEEAIERRKVATSEASRFAAHTRRNCARWRVPRKSPRGGYSTDKRVLESHGALVPRNRERERARCLKSPSALRGTAVEDSKAVIDQYWRLMQSASVRGLGRDEVWSLASRSLSCLLSELGATVVCEVQHNLLRSL